MMQSQRELSSFPLSSAHKVKLSSAGFLTVDDLKDVRPTELAKDLRVSASEALDILTTVQGFSSKVGVSQTRTALDILRQEDSSRGIITFSEQLDEMLGGGVPLCKVTELCGAPGVGKTQVCLQLSVDVQIPEAFGGLGGEAVYVDTEGSFIVERLVDIASATVEHCQQIAAISDNAEQMEALQTFSLESVLSRVHYYRCHDYVQLLATVHLLPDFIKEHPKVKLVVVDSIAFHFRHDFEDLALRTRLLAGLAQSFITMATANRLAVVLTNQMTTKISKEPHGRSHLVPALGESWGHASTIRVILYWENKQRYALLYKSPSRQETVVQYQVTVGGIRDVCEDSERVRDSSPEEHPPAKRPRH
ncbi:DNA repair protein RAD51 homolog 3-like [Liolophura sinensis]|uniref:DNA repair protein RAD51 homolog 3-like n=1 Tax=Liolophura sinensis TaxID=3198878 RepID=UPI0031589A30